MAHCPNDTTAIEENLKKLTRLKANVSARPPDASHVDEPTYFPDRPNDKLVLRYVTSWFPNLLVLTYTMAKKFFKEENEFKDFFKAPEIKYICS